jgi:hypothetical protein
VNWDAVQAIGVIVTLAFLGYQMRLQAKALKSDSRLRQFELYQSLLNQHTELLKMADNDKVLNLIWDPLDPGRKAELDAAQASRDWGAWSVMTEDEQRGYRYTRYAIELFEQAYKVNQYGMLDDEIWRKWVSWMEIWPRTRYFTYMWQDTARKFMPSFVDEYWELVRQSGEIDRNARRDRANLLDPLGADDVLGNRAAPESDAREFAPEEVAATVESIAPESPAVQAVPPSEAAPRQDDPTAA